MIILITKGEGSRIGQKLITYYVHVPLFVGFTTITWQYERKTFLLLHFQINLCSSLNSVPHFPCE